jgi:hypothetical protein
MSVLVPNAHLPIVSACAKLTYALSSSRNTDLLDCIRGSTKLLSYTNLNLYLTCCHNELKILQLQASSQSYIYCSKSLWHNEYTFNTSRDIE